ncbi:MAG: alpha-L-fucosidase, partial [Ruthenibacterium sp.]
MEDRFARSRWFSQARFGMFIHWGIYAIPARGEWVRSVEEIPKDQYEPFAQEFVPDSYDPRAWAKLAKQAGMQYAVLTAKHHDGFCLFDSKFTDFTSMHTCGKDLVKEYVEAFRAEGLRVGLYYSLLDWHHEDYPHYGDMRHPMRNNPACGNETRDFSNYLAYMHGQIEELCSNYGKLDILWFDFSYDIMTGEKWHAAELVRMVRRLQPDVIIDNRLETGGHGFGSLITETPTEYSGDFVSPEQIIPPRGIRNVQGEPVPWEACLTMNNSWGYTAEDTCYKSADMVIKKLVECVSKGGNMILNVGPDAHGRIPAQSVQILSQVGQWMADNIKSIYGCGYSDLEKPEYGRITRNNNFLY